MMPKKFDIVFLGLVIGLLMFTAVSLNAWESLDDNLKEQMSIVDDEQMLPVYVVMKEQYPPMELYEEVRDLSRSQRRETTIERLKTFSETTQRDVRFLVNDLENAGHVYRVKPLWITNIIALRADRHAISLLHDHPDIRSINYDPETYALLDFEDEEFDPDNDLSSINHQGNQSSRRRDDQYTRSRIPENKYRNYSYNVEQVNAPEVWELGYTGEGVIVAVLDTGVNYNHHDIRDRMWEHEDYPHHGYNFHADNYETMDGHSHGTHCAGTVAGTGESGTGTGVAPGATIMALKVLSDAGRGEHHMLWSAMEFAIEYGADLMSISLGWTNVPSQTRAIFRDVSTNVLNAGLIVAKSAGNRANQQGSLPIPHNLTVPADCPPPWLHPDQILRGGVSAMLSVGSTNIEDNIASSSSRGPTTWEGVEGYDDYPYEPGMGLIKPDICAPGVNVVSLDANNTTGYRASSGTSMAAPGVAGLMALMLSKNPNILPELISQIIEETALPLSETKNNTFGSGRIDALEAVQATFFIGLEEVSFTDDNNNIPEYGEQVNITITILNQGVEDVENVTGTLTTEDPYIEIINGEIQFGPIDPDSTLTETDAFTVQVADNVPDKHKAEFNLQLELDDDTNWGSSFDMEIRAPDFVTKLIHIYDPEPGGNNNGYIDPGETVIVNLPVKNRGGSRSQSVRFGIESETELAEIISLADTAFAFISVDEILYPMMSVSISEDVENGSMLPFNYFFTTGEYHFEGRLSLIVGENISFNIGTGDDYTGETQASPINMYFKSLRSQTVYTAQEMNEEGINYPTAITQMGYYVVGAPAYDLPNFTIRMKHTDANDASRHDDGPFETVLQTDSYSPSAGGWDLIELDEPFIWNGVDNILIDTVFSPTTAWNSSGQVRIIESENGFRFAREDEPDQREEPTDSAVDYKPQVTFVSHSGGGNVEERPQNLTAVMQGIDVVLDWDPPAEQRTGNQRSTRRDRNNRYNLSSYVRNPDGYNIYRNGQLMNDELIEDTEFIDDDYDPNLTYYYYVKAVYEDRESLPSNIANVRFQVAKPEMSHTEKIYYETFGLTLISDTPDTDIYYTLDGTEPTTQDYLYEEPIRIDYRQHVKARAFKEGWINSSIVAQEFAVMHSPEELQGEPDVNQVELTWDVPYAPDNRQADSIKRRTRRESHDERNAAIDEERNLIGYNVYRAVKPDSFKVINSRIVTFTRFIDENPPPGETAYYVKARYDLGESKPSNIVQLNGIVDKPEFSLNPGEYEGPMQIEIKCSTPQASIFYTLDGTKPDSSSYLYDEDEPLELLETATLKAIAKLQGWQESEIAVAEFISLSTDDDYLDAYTTQLKRAYPNPFNPQTTIEFSLKEPDMVTIEMFNISGQRIITIAEESFDKGIHRVIWNGTNEQGRQVGSGIYLYRMTTTGYSETRKVILLR